MTESSTVQMIEVDPDEAGQRIDNFLLKRLKGLPKSRVYRIIRKGEVRINGKRAKPQVKLQAGDVVRIPPIAHLPQRDSAIGTFKNLVFRNGLSGSGNYQHKGYGNNRLANSTIFVARKSQVLNSP